VLAGGEAVSAVSLIDFGVVSGSAEVNIFETTIRYLGGLLAAYDLSGHKVLKSKAVELGERLLGAFDTPNGMPVTHWHVGREGELRASSFSLLAEVGSLSVEFTRLSQVTGDGRYYDAIARVMEEFLKQQMKTKVPGLWPYVFHLG